MENEEFTQFIYSLSEEQLKEELLYVGDHIVWLMGQQQRDERDGKSKCPKLENNLERHNKYKKIILECLLKNSKETVLENCEATVK